MVRMRIGFKLSWPFANLATFVIYLPADKAVELIEAVQKAKAIISSFNPEVGNRLFCEKS